MTDTAPGSMAASSESANGYATFRDIVVVRGLTPGPYQLVPTVTIEGTTDWTGVVLPFTANVGVQLYGPDGKAVIHDTTLDTAQHSVAITRTLGGIPFTAGVPFNVMLGFGHAARLFRNSPANTSVTASYTMRVTGLTVLDALGRVVTGYDIGSLSGAAYSASGIERVDVEPPDFEFTVSGPEQTMIPNDNPWGLRHTPDEGMSYRTFDGELRMWFVGGVSTFLTRGSTFENHVPWPLKNGKAVPLIGPSGTRVRRQLRRRRIGRRRRERPRPVDVLPRRRSSRVATSCRSSPASASRARPTAASRGRSGARSCPDPSRSRPTATSTRVASAIPASSRAATGVGSTCSSANGGAAS